MSSEKVCDMTEMTVKIKADEIRERRENDSAWMPKVHRRGNGDAKQRNYFENTGELARRQTCRCQAPILRKAGSSGRQQWQTTVAELNFIK